jgi:7-carboxy-7-deazaguanine synthase
MKIHSIFESISGEAGPVIAQGAWTTFIRTQGCQLLHCRYCDTKETWDPNKGMELSAETIAESIFTQNVLLTGGEPLEQPESYELINLLLKRNHTVQVETNGTIWDLPDASRLGYAVDIKCPCSGMEHHMPEPKTVGLIQQGNIDLKFVVEDEKDVTFAMRYIKVVAERSPRIRFVFSPVNAVSNPDLIRGILSILKREGQWILDRTVFSLQIHKILNLP